MQNTKFCVKFLVAVMLAGNFILSSAVSSLMTNVVIQSTGQISTTNIIAASGSAEDIQAAVDLVAGSGDGTGNVHIPEGTFNFVEVGEPWMHVNVPAGVNLFGAPTERASGYPEPSRGMSPNDQVVEWKTVLVMPFEAPGNPSSMERWFYIWGDGENPFRFSDIKLVGYRDINNSSAALHRAMDVINVPNLRIDHCFFKHTAAGTWLGYPNTPHCYGVVDHCRFVNEYGVPEPYESESVGYGVGMGCPGTTLWEDDIDQVLGHYNNNTIFIEDCYFSRWRHCACSGYGQHYVFRHNTIEHDCGFGSIDGHGVYVNVGTRAMEIYKNIIVDPIDRKKWDSKWPDDPSPWTTWGVFWRGGGGIFWDNYARNYSYVVTLGKDADEPVKCLPHDIWIWGNQIENGILLGISSGTPEEGVDYFLYEKEGYVPYPYPHPLTFEGAS